MTLTPLQLQRIRAIGIAKAVLHPELARPLTLAAAKAILHRERVGLEFRAHPRPAQLVRMADGWKIVVDERSSDAERLVVIMHEIAHRWLGHVIEDDPIVFDQSEPWHHDARELEANHYAEMLISGPVPDSAPISRGKKRNRHAASNVQMATRKPEPPAPLPGWLEEVERDADAIRLNETARVVARQDAQHYAKTHGPLLAGPTIQFAIPRDAWNAVRLEDAQFPHYQTAGAGMFEFVTCTAAAARSIVEQLAKAGHKRTAVFLRRRIREATGN